MIADSFRPNLFDLGLGVFEPLELGLLGGILADEEQRPRGERPRLKGI